MPALRLPGLSVRLRRLHTDVVIGLVFVLTLGMTWAVSQRMEAAAERQGITNAFAESGNLAQLLKLHWSGMGQRIDALQRLARLVTRAPLNGSRNGAELLAELRSSALLAGSSILQVAALDPAGDLIWTILQMPPERLNLAQRDYYQAIARDGRDSFIGGPVRGAVSGHWSFQFAEALRDPDHTLRAITVVSVDTGWAEALASELDIADRGVISLVRNDGLLLARNPNVHIGEVIPPQNSVWFAAWQRGAAEALLPGPRDGVLRFYAARRVPNSDIVVVTGLNAADRMAQAQATITTIRRATAGFALALTGLAVSVSVGIRRQRSLTTERQRTHDLAAREGLLRHIAEQATDVICLQDAGLRNIFVSPAVRTLLGIEPQQLIGCRFGSTVLPADTPTVEAALTGLERSGTPQRFIVRGRHADGGFRWVETEMVAVADPGDPTGCRYLSISRDVTEAQTAHQRIETLLDLKSLLSSTNEMIARGLPLSDLFDGICQACVSQGRFQLAWIGMADPEHETVRCVAQAGPATEYAKHLFISLDPTLPTGQGPTALAMREDRHIIVNDYAASTITGPWHDAAKQFGLAAAASFPLHLQGKPVGQIAVYANRVNFFDEELIVQLRQLAANVSFAMDAVETETERVRAEIRLRESEQRFRSLVESPLAGIAIFDSGHIRYANDRFAEIFACLPADLTEGRFNWIEAGHAALIGDVERKLEGGLSPAPFRMPAKRRDGQAMIVECYFSRSPNGQQGSTILMLQDITERDRIEHALRESEEGLRATFENAAVGIARLGLDGRWLAANETFCGFLGYSAEEVTTLDLDATICPNDQAVFHAATDALRAGEQRSIAFSKRFVRRTGEIVWGRAAVSARRDSAGNLLEFITAVADITAQHMAEEEVSDRIRQMEAALRGTLEAVARMVEQRDPYTAGHERRVGQIAAAIGREMGLTEAQCEQLELTGLVHDIGKISIPTEILTYPGRLGHIQMELVKTHAEKGYEILKDLPFAWPLAEMVRQHHERMDGSGYPRGIKGDAILLEARILAVADVLEAMSAHRPYRPALGEGLAIAEITDGRGRIYDAEVVDAALRLIREKGYSLTALMACA